MANQSKPINESSYTWIFYILYNRLYLESEKISFVSSAPSYKKKRIKMVTFSASSVLISKYYHLLLLKKVLISI